MVLLPATIENGFIGNSAMLAFDFVSVQATCLMLPACYPARTERNGSRSIRDKRQLRLAEMSGQSEKRPEGRRVESLGPSGECIASPRPTTERIGCH